jgi:signal transduction histidine kinase
LLGDLHDGVGSALANIRLVSNEKQTLQLAGDALFELRNFLYDGPEYTMTRRELVADIREYARNLFSSTDVEFKLKVEGEIEAPIARSVALTIFRMLKEAMSNSLKHSDGRSLVAELSFGMEEPGFLAVVVSDDGGRTDVEQVGRGLSGIATRTKELGGSAEWDWKDGFRLELRLPL